MHAGHLSPKNANVSLDMRVDSKFPVKTGRRGLRESVSFGMQLTLCVLSPPDVLVHFADNLIINLPRNKYTVREREMLMGAGAPSEWFASDDFGIFGAGLAVGAAVYAAVSYAISKHRDD